MSKDVPDSKKTYIYSLKEGCVSSSKIGLSPTNSLRLHNIASCELYRNHSSIQLIREQYRNPNSWLKFALSTFKIPHSFIWNLILIFSLYCIERGYQYKQQNIILCITINLVFLSSVNQNLATKYGNKRYYVFFFKIKCVKILYTNAL